MRDEPAVLQSTNGEPMTLTGVTARGSVRGLLFELTVEQRYRNAGRKNIEVVYTFPLPSHAVLLDLDVELGPRKLSAVVVEKKEATGRYEKAIDKGDTAIMLEDAGDGLYTLNLGNLMAGEEATIRYRYAQLLRFEHGSLRLSIPTVIAPRYGDPAKAGLAPHQVPATDLGVECPFALTIDLAGDIAQGALSSPSHPIATTRTEEGTRISLARRAFLDRDFVLNVGGLTGRSLAVVGQDGDRFVALASFCADLPRDANELPLTVKLLVDCSGSMAGDSIEAARRALHRILEGLAGEDRFAFSRFGSTVVHATTGLLPATASNVRAASAHLARMAADLGGTEMPAALRDVFALGGGEAPADVLLITDGEIWDVEGLAAEASAAKQRVFVVGIGSAPAEGVLARLAEASGGACEFVAPNEDAEGAILRMFARLRAPRVERARIAWPVTPSWMTPLPTALFGGETIHAFAGFVAAPPDSAALELMPRGEGVPMTAKVLLPTTVIADRTLARVAAARRLESATEAEQLQLALDYGLLTARTNLLVVHERAEGEKAIDLPELAKVAQMHAAGWHGVGSVAASMTFSAALSAPSEGPVRLRNIATLSIDKAAVPSGREDADDVLYSLAITDNMGRSEPTTSFGPFLIALEPMGSKRLPTTIDELSQMGLPAEIVAKLRDLVLAGHDEKDIVHALFEAIGNLIGEGAIAAPVSRQFARLLRRAFSDPDECQELRGVVGAVMREGCVEDNSRPSDLRLTGS